MLGPLKRKMMSSSNCSSLPLSRLRNLKSHFMIYDLRSTPERYLFLGSHDILGFDTIITQYSRYLRFGKKMRVNFRKCDISVRRWRTHCAPFATRRGCSQWGGRGDEQHPAPHHHLEKWLEDEQDLDWQETWGSWWRLATSLWLQTPSQRPGALPRCTASGDLFKHVGSFFTTGKKDKDEGGRLHHRRRLGPSRLCGQLMEGCKNLFADFVR